MTDSDSNAVPGPADDSLAGWLEHYQIPLPQDKIDQLARYCQLLWEENRKLNLTRHTTNERFVARDVLDCWELGKLLAEGEEVLDVGTGGGVPGVLLGILRPDLQIALCDSVGKKAAAVDQIVAQLGLPMAVHAARAEDILVDFRYDTLVTRAVGPLWKILFWFRESWASMKRLLVLKGPRWVDERKEARHRGLLHPLELRRVASYPMPDTESESVILQIEPKQRT